MIVDIASSGYLLLKSKGHNRKGFLQEGETVHHPRVPHTWLGVGLSGSL